MGQSINRINKDYIIGILNEKISSYENMIKENYIEDFSCNKKFIINYANSLIDGIFNDTNNKKIYLNFLERLLFDEVAFLSYLTASDNEKCGIVYNNGDRVLYQGLNQALTLTVINTMALYQGKSQTFEYPSMMKERSNLTLLQVKEVASYDILNILGKDVYKCYFNGDGLEFHKKMQEFLNIRDEK